MVSLALLSLAVACSTSDSGSGDPPEESLPTIQAIEPDWPALEFRQVELVVSAPDGRRSTTFRVYDPANRSARLHGLMGVSELPDDAGMLFRFPAPQDGGFWMKNTLLPLSIAFADSEGTIFEILDMEPCTAEPCPRYRPAKAFVNALEVKRSVLQTSGIEPGWRLVIPSDLPAPPR